MQTTLGLSNISFGLNPAARVVLNSVFLHECLKAGLDSAIVHAAKILPMSKIDDEQRQVALDLVHDRRRWVDDDPSSGRLEYDPLQRFLDLFEGVDAASLRAGRAEELAALPLSERLARRIVDGERKGLEDDLDEALASGQAALDIINDNLLEGMRVVGELFGRGEMQLPFVLQSAEVMKAAVAHLEPHIEGNADGSARESKATIVLATVKGDVHDIGKNLVDIILSNNGYDVVNIGIKQPVSEILAGRAGAPRRRRRHERPAREVHRRDEGEPRRRSTPAASRPTCRCCSAAPPSPAPTSRTTSPRSTRARCATPATRSRACGSWTPSPAPRPTPALSVSDTLPELRKRRVRRVERVEEPDAGPDTPPLGRRHRRPGARRRRSGAPAWSRASRWPSTRRYLDERATFLGQWGLKPSRGDGPSYEELVETDGRPRLRMWLDRIHTEGLMEAAVVYGYFPCVSEGNDLVILHHEGPDAGQRAGAVHLPAPAARPAAVPRRLLPAARVGARPTSSRCSW